MFHLTTALDAASGVQKVTNDTSYQSNIESKKENINPSDVIPQPASANKKKQFLLQKIQIAIMIY